MKAGQLAIVVYTDNKRFDGKIVEVLRSIGVGSYHKRGVLQPPCTLWWVRFREELLCKDGKYRCEATVPDRHLRPITPPGAEMKRIENDQRAAERVL